MKGWSAGGRAVHARHVDPPPPHRAAAVAGCVNVNYRVKRVLYTVFDEASRNVTCIL